MLCKVLCGTFGTAHFGGIPICATVETEKWAGCAGRSCPAQGLEGVGGAGEEMD